MAPNRRLSYDPYNDYYVALGISAFATPDEIQSAFRQRAKVLHPDRNADDAAKGKFQSLSEAYNVLSDPDLRADYNTLRQEAGRGTAGSTGTDRSANRSGYGRKVLGGLFSGPYRYVFLVIGLVAIANMVFIIATRFSHLPTETLSEPISVPQPLDPAPTCDPGATIISPANNAMLTSAFDIFGSANGAYQVDWSPLNPDNAGRPQYAWSFLGSGKTPVIRGMLVTRTQTASLSGALSTPGRFSLRLTVTPADGQPFQTCQITLRLSVP